MRTSIITGILLMIGINAMAYELKIDFLTPKRQDVLINVEAPNTIAEVKAKIEDKTGIPAANQKLIVEGKELLDKQSLEEAQITATTRVVGVIRK